jgi:hypothetical protein
MEVGQVKRSWFVAVALAVGLSALNVVPAQARRGAHARPVTVAGAVNSPTSYSLGQLAAQPQTTFSVTRRTRRGLRTQTDAGVNVENLVNTADPIFPPNLKNPILRVTVTVGNAFGQHVTLALAELDPSFGNHPAYLALSSQHGHRLPAPELVLPGDTTGARTVPFVDRITVAVQNPTPTTPPTAGSLTIIDHGITRVLSASTLASLPAETLEVSFLAGTASQQHTEIGPTLSTVLRAAHIRANLNTWVAAVGSDSYVATVTPAEAWVGGQPLLISLNEDGQPLSQPRLIVDGDVKGGRYVSDVDDFVLGEGSLRP